jgi:hypothetical protein
MADDNKNAPGLADPVAWRDLLQMLQEGGFLEKKIQEVLRPVLEEAIPRIAAQVAEQKMNEVALTAHHARDIREGWEKFTRGGKHPLSKSRVLPLAALAEYSADPSKPFLQHLEEIAKDLGANPAEAEEVAEEVAGEVGPDGADESDTSIAGRIKEKLGKQPKVERKPSKLGKGQTRRSTLAGRLEDALKASKG